MKALLMLRRNNENEKIKGGLFFSIQADFFFVSIKKSDRKATSMQINAQNYNGGCFCSRKEHSLEWLGMLNILCCPVTWGTKIQICI